MVTALERGTRLGSYEILDLVGKGGMGEVYRARDTKLGRLVALKVLPAAVSSNAGRIARFRTEARALAALNHPGIAGIHGLEEERGTPFLVLELVEGETLAMRLGRGPIPVQEAIAIAAEIAEALAEAHARGLVHRDLKPDNVKLTPEGRVKLLDFGLAKAFSGEQDGTPEDSRTATVATPQTVEGAILGTVAYMSPQQARGEAVDHRADIWAFGVVLFEMLTGRRLFAGATPSDVIASVMKDSPDWSRLPATTPAGVRRLLRRCLEREPRNRLHAMADARLDLTEDPEPPRAATDSGRRATPWIVAILAGALAISVWAPWRRGPLPPRPLRMEARLSPGVALGTDALAQGTALALSPDGDRIAFVGRDADGPPRIYTRRVDALRASPLPGTEGAHTPFFSPDGGWVAFFAGGSLRKVSVNGGAPLELCDAPWGLGGSWGPDGTIVFTPSGYPNVGLWRVSAAGRCESFLKPDSAAGELSLRWPQWLPGGRGVLYTASLTLGSHDAAHLVVDVLPGGPRKTILDGGYHGRYVPSGQLLFAREGTLFAVPFDLDSLSTTGDAVPALDGVMVDSASGSAQLAFSQDGTVVYAPGEAASLVAPIHWMSRDGSTSPLLREPVNWAHPRFSPAGDRLALQIHDGTKWDVWVYDLTRDTLSRLTYGPAPNFVPVWTPDGERVAFTSSRSGVNNLYWRRSDGSGDVQRLTDSENWQAATSWHPDGRSLGISERRPDTGYDLMTLSIEGDEEGSWRPGASAVFLSTTFDEVYPVFSPDGRWVAYLSDESGQQEVYVRPFPGPGGKWQVSNGGGQVPSWSRTRSELLYGTQDGTIMVVRYTAQSGSFRPEKPALWSPGPFALRPLGVWHFDLHPDGKRVALQIASEATEPDAPETAVIVTGFFDELRRLTE